MERFQSKIKMNILANLIHLRMIKTLLTLLAIPLVVSSAAQGTKMDFEKYEPVSTLVVPEHKLARSKFPFIDVHNHQFEMPSMDLGELIREMDKLNMSVMVNLSGDSGNKIKQSVKNIKD